MIKILGTYLHASNSKEFRAYLLRVADLVVEVLSVPGAADAVVTVIWLLG